KSAAVWGNNVLGRKVFPVIDSTDREIWRLARVNTVLVFAFTFLLQVVASFLGLFFTSLIIFVALVGVAAYFARTRSVIIKP
ncbi:MAG: hypothetical protein ACJ78Q_09650, partial [Chloroflexia bacterium]